MKNTAQKIIDMALSMGANECEVIMNKGRSLSFKANEGKLEEHKVSGTQVAGVRLKAGGRLGTSYSESFDDDSLRMMVRTALDTSKYSKVSEFESICATDDGQNADATNEATWRLDETSDEEKIDATLKLEADVLKRGSEFKSAPYNGLSENEAEKFIANHLGVSRSIKRRVFSAYTSALVEDAGKQSMHYYGNSSLNFKQLDLQRCVDVSCSVAKDLLNGTPIKTGNYDVIFDSDNLAELWGCFMRIFSAKAAIDKVNPWSEKLGKQVATSALNIIDDPKYPGGMAYQAFDDEGLLSKALPLIQDGKLCNFLHNTATAKEMKTDNNARASRGARSSLGVASTHLVFAPGIHTDEQLHAGQYLEIVSLQGLHSGVDVISGDFSFGGAGFLMKDGKRTQAVRNITISGNFYELLMDLGPMGTTLKASSDATFFAPEIRFQNISIGGQ
jgi:PmbA protein